MPTTSVSVLGVPQLLLRFAKTAVAAEVAETVATSTLAEDIAASARSIVPVATGRLRDSIQADAGRVYTDVEYAAFVEYGTSDTPAQPYMRPAADTVDDSRALGLAAQVLNI